MRQKESATAFWLWLVRGDLRLDRHLMGLPNRPSQPLAPAAGFPGIVSPRASLLLACSVMFSGLSLVAQPVRLGSAESPTGLVTMETGPGIRFDSSTFSFGTVDAGTVIQHDFFFTNTGVRLLEITKVRTSCGCTAATNWDRTVEAGKVGKITARLDTSGLLGSLSKHIYVDSNAPDQTNVVLLISGTVFQPIQLTPPYVAFSPAPDAATNEVRTVRISNNTEQPITLNDPVCTNRAFQAHLKTIKPGYEFELTITASAPFKERKAQTAITLSTSSSRTPVLTAGCYLNVLPALVVNPTQITLPTSPLASALTSVITIRNNTSKALVLSKPEVSVEGVQISLKESQPGRQYSMVLTFPSGFQTKAGQLLEARVSSNDPEHPLITIPIFQISDSGGESARSTSAVDHRATDLTLVGTRDPQ